MHTHLTEQMMEKGVGDVPYDLPACKVFICSYIVSMRVQFERPNIRSNCTSSTRFYISNVSKNVQLHFAGPCKQGKLLFVKKIAPKKKRKGSDGEA